MTLAYISKAVYAGIVTFLGALLAALQAAPDIGFADLSSAAWITIALATIVVVGGVLGLQSAPATIATGIKPSDG
jgi:hypothetical protein